MPGADAQERIVRATIRNAGPADITVNAFNFLRIDFVILDVAGSDVSSGSTTAPGWTCGGACFSQDGLSLLAGATVPVEFVVRSYGDFSQGRAALGVSVRSDSPLPVPDPNPHNNTRYGMAGNAL